MSRYFLTLIAVLSLAVSLGCSSDSSGAGEHHADSDVGASDPDAQPSDDAGDDAGETLSCPSAFADLDEDCRCVREARLCLRDAEECGDLIDPDTLDCEPGDVLWHVHYERKDGGSPIHATSPNGYLYVFVKDGGSFTDSAGQEVDMPSHSRDAPRSLLAFDPEGRLVWRAELESDTTYTVLNFVGIEDGVQLQLAVQDSVSDALDVSLTTDSDQHRVAGEMGEKKYVVAELRSDGQVERFDGTLLPEDSTPHPRVGCYGQQDAEGYGELFVPATGEFRSWSRFDASGNCYFAARHREDITVDGELIDAGVEEGTLPDDRSLVGRISSSGEVGWINQLSADSDIEPRDIEVLDGMPVVAFEHMSFPGDINVTSTDGEVSMLASLGSSSMMMWNLDGGLRWAKVIVPTRIQSGSSVRVEDIHTDDGRVAVIGNFSDGFGVINGEELDPVLHERSGRHTYVGLVDANGEFQWVSSIFDSTTALDRSTAHLAGRNLVVAGMVDEPVTVDGHTYERSDEDALSDFVFVRLAAD